MSENLFRIVYCSRKAVDEGGISMDQILATSRRNNAAVGVTGALLYSGGLFVQTLEGPFDAVQSVFERIQMDLRHDDVIVIATESVTERLFAEWSMAAAEPDDPTATHALVEQTLLMPDSAASATLIALLSQVLTYAPA